MCLSQGPQRSDADEARTRCPSVSSQAFYHLATALPRLVSKLSAITCLCLALDLAITARAEHLTDSVRNNLARI